MSALLDLRTRLGWSQSGMARHLGVNAATVHRMEQGQRPSGPVERLLAALEAAVERGEAPDEPPASPPSKGVEFREVALRIPEVCLATGIGRTAIYSAIKAGRLRARKVGERTIVLRTDLEAFLAALPAVHAA